MISLDVSSKAGVPNTSIVIDQSIAKVLWVDRMALQFFFYRLPSIHPHYGMCHLIGVQGSQSEF